MDDRNHTETDIVDGQLKFDVILKEPYASRFIVEAQESERGLSPHARYCIKKYYEWKYDIEQIKKLEIENRKLQEEIARLRQFVAGGSPAAGLPGPDYRPGPSKPGLRESAG